ncbi:MAG TPA: hypothetical protein VGV86_06570 [Acidimicrobiales bacterium]|nr:hypothetical protein [Acidimicrobiales bacterium]
MGAGPAAAAALGPAANGRVVMAGPTGLWIADEWGNRARRVVGGEDSSGFPDSPRWSHDGTRIAYSRGDDIWIVNADGTGNRPLPRPLHGGRSTRSPVWSPDDSRVYYAAVEGVYWASTNSTAVEAISGVRVNGLSLSPDGRTIAFDFAAKYDISEGIFTMGSDGSAVTRLTGTASRDNLPIWSPDGTRILLTRIDATSTAAWVEMFDADGTNRVVVTKGFARAWSPDGRSVLYTGAPGNRLHRMRLDGSEQLAMGGCTYWGGNADWQATSVPSAAQAGPARSWGWNNVGQLGTGSAGTGTARPTPAVAPTDVVSVSDGFYHSLALRKDGAVWASGWNAFGQLGDGTTTERDAPVKIPGLPRITCVAAGALHSLAVDTEGGVWAWGWNAVGQLGDGTTTDRHRPVRVANVSRAYQVSAGLLHSFAVDSARTGWAWGWNGFGQLGDGTTTDRHAPVSLAATAGPLRQLAAGGYHSLALTLDGELRGWGWNASGQVGDATTVTRSNPSPVVSPGAGVVQVAAGGAHSLAAAADGTVWSWGDSTWGQLGTSSAVGRASPGPVPGLTGQRYVTAGWVHSLALGGEGAVATWGWNALGQLGDGTTQTRFAPVSVSGIAGVTAIAGGAFHSSAA